MYELQTTVNINGASFGIRNKGDFRMVLDCFKELNNPELSETERVYTALIIFYKDFNDLDNIMEHSDILDELRNQMFIFFDGGDEMLQSNTGNHRLLDWDKDSTMICSAINPIANKEIRDTKYLHWWTFLGYYMAIGESLLSHVLSIRYKIATGKKLEKHERQFRQQNPQYFNVDLRTAEQQAAEEYIQQLWGESKCQNPIST